MLSNQDQFKAALIPYLRQFVQQAQLCRGQFVEQLLRLRGELAARKFAHMGVHRPVMLADFGRIVFERLQPQQLVVVERAGRFSDFQPVAINVERLGHSGEQLSRGVRKSATAGRPPE